MSNFTAGPITATKLARKVAGGIAPYTRTESFEAKVVVCEEFLKKIVGAPPQSVVSMLTTSGTGAMEAAVLNWLDNQSRVLVVSAGRFGTRWCNILDAYQIPHQTLTVPLYEKITSIFGDYTHIFCQSCETSTGHKINLEILSDYCKQHGSHLIIDHISGLYCDALDMKELGADAIILSSQKALGLLPGMAFTVMISPVRSAHIKSYYLNYQNSISKGGRLPFTCASMIIEQLYQKILHHEYEDIFKKTKRCAAYFRQGLQTVLPSSILPSNLSVGMTPVFVKHLDLPGVIKEWQNLGIYVMEAYDEMRPFMFRVGHYGGQHKKRDYDILLELIRKTFNS